MTRERLQKSLERAGLGSRRACEAWRSSAPIDPSPRRGVFLDGRRTGPAKAQLIRYEGDRTWLLVEM